jgi:prevent-host-death family protein
MKLSESVKPISYLKAHASELIREVAEDHKTLVITHNGEAKAIVQDLESYEQMNDTLALLKMLAQSSKSKQEGKYKSAKQAFRDIRSQAKELK